MDINSVGFVGGKWKKWSLQSLSAFHPISPPTKPPTPGRFLVLIRCCRWAKWMGITIKSLNRFIVLFITLTWALEICVFFCCCFASVCSLHRFDGFSVVPFLARSNCTRGANVMTFGTLTRAPRSLDGAKNGRRVYSLFVNLENLVCSSVCNAEGMIRT